MRREESEDSPFLPTHNFFSNIIISQHYYHHHACTPRKRATLHSRQVVYLSLSLILSPCFKVSLIHTKIKPKTYINVTRTLPPPSHLIFILIITTRFPPFTTRVNTHIQRCVLHKSQSSSSS